MRRGRAGILREGTALCSIGTSGVVLTYESNRDQAFDGNIHFLNHAAPNAFYSMGVTLSAGRSFSWFKDVFAGQTSFDELISDIDHSRPGARGLLFTPYLSGERTPHADADIRASFIGMDSAHTRATSSEPSLKASHSPYTRALNNSVPRERISAA